MPQYYQMPGSRLPAFRALDAFTQGYIEAMFWTEQDSLMDAAQEGKYPAPAGGYGFADLAPESLAQIIAECEAFQADNTTALHFCYERGYEQEAGREFWIARNAHTAGYGSRQEGTVLHAATESLDASARACGERSAYLGTDGLVYVERG